VPSRSIVRVALFTVLVVTTAACGGDPGPTASPTGASGLDGTSWIVLTANGRAPVAGAVPTLSFAGGRVQGFLGCNQGGGAYRLDPSTGRFAVGEMAITTMACARAEIMAFESTVAQALSGASQASMDPAGHLILSGPGGRLDLVTLEHPAAP